MLPCSLLFDEDKVIKSQQDAPPNVAPEQQQNKQSRIPRHYAHSFCYNHPAGYPTTVFMLRLSKKPPRSSFLTSTTQCSKLSIRTRALVSATTSWKALPNLLRP